MGFLDVLRKLVLISFLSLTSCAYLQKNLKEPEVKLKKVDVKDMTFNDAKFVFNFDIKNPNKVPVNIDQVTYNLELNGKPFSQGVHDEKINLGAESSAQVPLAVKVKYNDLMQSLTDYLQDRVVRYKLDGSVKMGLISIPYKSTGEVELDKN